MLRRRRRKVKCVVCKGIGRIENFDIRNPDLREVECSECSGTGALSAGRASELLTRWRYEDKLEARRRRI